MRHKKLRNKLGRDSAHRKSLLTNLSKEIIEHERIKTSQAKAKAAKPEIEKLITLAKRGDLHARRQALSSLRQDKFAVHKLFEEIAPRYAERPGGYTRIVKLGKNRLGDGAELALLQFVGAEEGPEIGGRVSTRRRIADKRTAYAAKVRKELAAKPAETAKA